VYMCVYVFGWVGIGWVCTCVWFGLGCDWIGMGTCVSLCLETRNNTQQTKHMHTFPFTKLQALLQRHEAGSGSGSSSSRSSMERDNRLAVFLAALHGRDSLLTAAAGGGGGAGGGRACLETHVPTTSEEGDDGDTAAPTTTAAAAAAAGAGGRAAATSVPAWFPEGKRNRVCELVRAVLLSTTGRAATDTNDDEGEGEHDQPYQQQGRQQQQHHHHHHQQQQQQHPPLPPHLLEPILTTLGRQDPPRFAAALRLIQRECAASSSSSSSSRGRNNNNEGGQQQQPQPQPQQPPPFPRPSPSPSLSGEKAQRLLRYLAFFAPESDGGVDALYDVALGMHDFALARALARLSPRKDPREYLPQLERWEAMRPQWRARVEVDLLLKRPLAALAHMAAAGAEGEEGEVDPQEVVGIAEAHALEEEALGLFSPPRRCPAVYARLLGRVAAARAGRGEHRGAMAAYLALAAVGGKGGGGGECPLLCAAECAKGAGEWATALALVARHEREEEEEQQQQQGGGSLVAMWARQLMVSAAGDAAVGAIPLGGGGEEGERRRARLVEAARLGLECVGDVEGAVSLLVRARAWGEALRVAACSSGRDVVATLVRPAVVEVAGALAWEQLPRMTEGYEDGCPRLAALLVRVAAEDAAAAEAAREKALAQAEAEGVNGGGTEGGSLFSAATGDSVGSAASYRSVGSSFSNSSRHSRLTWATEAAVSTAPSSSSSASLFGGGVRTETRQERRAKYLAAKRARARPPTAREEEGRLRRELQGLVPSEAMLGEVASLLEALLALGDVRRARCVLRAARALVLAVAAQPLPRPPPPLPSLVGGGEGRPPLSLGGGGKGEEEGEEGGVDVWMEKALGRFVFLLGPGGAGGEEEEEDEEEEPA
jgi:hypothetical protein